MTIDVDIRLLTGGDTELAAPPEVAIHGAIPRALFAVLALNAGQWLARDYIADLLWSDADQSSARNRLRMALFNLRQSVGGPLVDRLKSTKEMLCLDVPRQQVDVLKFADLCSDSDRAAQAAAIELYRGDLLARFPAISENFDAMLSARREELRTKAVVLLQQTLSDFAAADEMQLFENYLGKALQIDRTNSKTYELAMRQFAEMGMEGRIEDIFQSYEKAMDEDLDLPPSETVRMLSRGLIEKARAHNVLSPSADEISANAPAEGVYNPVLQSFPKRRAFGAFCLIGFMAVALALAAAWTILPQLMKSAEIDSTVFLVQPYEIQMENCGIDDASNRYDRFVIAALRKIPGSNVVLVQRSRFSVPASSRTFKFDQLVICSNDLLRTTVILTGSSAGDIKWVGRYEIKANQLDYLTGRIYDDINAALANE